MNVKGRFLDLDSCWQTSAASTMEVKFPGTQPPFSHDTLPAETSSLLSHTHLLNGGFHISLCLPCFPSPSLLCQVMFVKVLNFQREKISDIPVLVQFFKN